MSLEEKAIRTAFKELLLGKTIAQDRWSTNRGAQVWADNAPAGVIYTVASVDEVVTDAPRQYHTRLTLAIELFGKDDGGEPFDDQLSDFETQVKQVVDSNLSLPGLPELGISTSLSARKRVDRVFSDDGAQRLVGSRITYEIVYGNEVAEGDPADLDTFAIAGIDWDFPPPGVDGEHEADDVVELETG
ncbi:MAG: hypothetical protein AAF682_19615 [Planctomycetota bacterium]